MKFFFNLVSLFEKHQWKVETLKSYYQLRCPIYHFYILISLEFCDKIFSQLFVGLSFGMSQLGKLTD